MSALHRLRRRRRQLAPLLAGLVVTVVAAVVLAGAHHSAQPPVSSRVAIAAALSDGRVASELAGTRWTRLKTNPIDARLERVSFWSGDQIVAEAAVDRGGHVTAVADDHNAAVPYGDWIAYQPALLIALSVVFLLVTLVTPWRRMRNLDALAALSLVGSVVLFQHRHLDPSMLAAAPGLIYLLTRCAWNGLGPARGAPPARPLLTTLTRQMPSARRVHWLRVALVVVALIFVMIGVSSPYAVDVAYAVMEGATNLVHGVLPYGHMPPGIIHGDTYPILSYALYAPLALFAPVRSEWYSVDGALAVAVLAALATAWVARRCVAAAAARPAEAEEAGLRAALAVLSFPAFLITASTGTTDLVMAAMLGVALLLWRRPAAGAGMLALAGSFKLAPFALLPVFLAPLRGRRMARALGAVALVSFAVLALLIGVGGIAGPAAMLHGVSYQFTRGSLQSIWSALGISGLQPFAQACALGLIAAAGVRLRRDPQLAHDRSRMAATAVAILIALQLAADYWAFLYLVWFVPLASVALFGSAEQPVAAHDSVRVALAPQPVPA